MRLASFVTAAAALGTATQALAHPGHLAEAGGHDHWSLLGGVTVLAAAGALAIWAWRRT